MPPDTGNRPREHASTSVQGEPISGTSRRLTLSSVRRQDGQTLEGEGLDGALGEPPGDQFVLLLATDDARGVGVGVAVGVGEGVGVGDQGERPQQGIAGVVVGLGRV